jgi:hypothetical protein
VEDDISPEQRVSSLNSDDKSKSELKEYNKQSSNLITSGGVNSPTKNFSPKRKMFDLYSIRNFADVTVGDVFGFKNRLFLKIVFRSVIHNTKFMQKKGKTKN